MNHLWWSQGTWCVSVTSEGNPTPGEGSVGPHEEPHVQAGGSTGERRWSELTGLSALCANDSLHVVTEQAHGNSKACALHQSTPWTEPCGRPSLSGHLSLGGARLPFQPPPLPPCQSCSRPPEPGGGAGGMGAGGRGVTAFLVFLERTLPSETKHIENLSNTINYVSVLSEKIIKL